MLAAVLLGSTAASAQSAPTIFLPLIRSGVAWPSRTVEVIPIAGAPVARPAAVNPDLNLALRSYAPTSAPLTLVDYGGDTDGDPPQLAALFAPRRLPAFVAAYRVYDWDWSGAPDGSRGDLIAWPPVTLLALGATPGELLYLPARRSAIYSGDFVALVLYADATRMTLTYTRDDSPAQGYMVHLEGLAIDPALVARYAEMNAAGRGQLPALRNGELVGMATGSSVLVAVRDTGSFLDPRARKDWWQDAGGQ